MAEVKNAFIKSKMNKDLDDRLIPSGEYRDALNVQVSKSESSDVGALENVIGNSESVDFALLYAQNKVSSSSAQTGKQIILTSVIGLKVGMLYITPQGVRAKITAVSFVGAPAGIVTLDISFNISVPPSTNVKIIYDIKCIGYFVDEFNNNIYSFFTDFTDNSGGLTPDYSSLANNFIFKYNVSNGDVTTLVEGNWLNFSKTNPITGVNLLEDLLFFTDNRNQPRKINVTKANSDTSDRFPTYYANEDQVSVAKYNPYEPIKVITTTQGSNQASLIGAETATATGQSNNTKVISLIGAPSAPINIGDGINGTGVKTNTFVVGYNSASQEVTTNKVQFLVNVALKFGGLQTTMQDVSSAVLPDGTTTNPYYNASYGGDPNFLEDKFIRFSYRFQFDDGENSIFAPFTQPCFIPKQDGYFINQDEQDALESTIVSFMENKVTEIQLQIPLPTSGLSLLSAYKVKAIDILYKESDGLAVKVVETIPVDSIFTTATGNNDVYQYNYQSTKPFKTLPSKELIRVYDKIPVKALSQEITGNRIVYGNFQNKHTPPQALNYQVAVFDKYAKDSDLGNKTIIEYPNSTVKQNRNYQVGIVLSDKFGRQSSTLLSNKIGDLTTGVNVGFGSSTVYSPYLKSADTAPAVWPGDSLKVLFNDVIASSVNSITGTPGLYNGDDTSASYNPLGWYSYKVVVQQKEQDYYNIYNAGAMKGDPLNTAIDISTSYISLVSDNINKVPRDLSEVGPQQKQFRSSVRLVGRVQNLNSNNKQYYPGLSNSGTSETSTTFSVSSIENLQDIFDVAAFKTDASPTPTEAPVTSNENAYSPFFKAESNPLIARISTGLKIDGFGVSNTKDAATDPNDPSTYDAIEKLAIFETEPDLSLLDFYFETSTSGLISELNTLISIGTQGAVGFNYWDYLQTEADVIGTTVAGFVSDGFSPIDKDNVVVFNSQVTLIVKDGSNTEISGWTVNQTGDGTAAVPHKYTITTSAFQYYGSFSSQIDSYTFTFIVTDLENSITNFFTEVGVLGNISPTIDAGATQSINIARGQTGIISTQTGLNGTADPNRNTNNLTWDKVSGKSTLTISNDGVIRNSNNVEGGKELMTIRVIDGGGLFVESDIVFTFGNSPVPSRFIQDTEIMTDGDSQVYYFVDKNTATPPVYDSIDGLNNIIPPNQRQDYLPVTTPDDANKTKSGYVCTTPSDKYEWKREITTPLNDDASGNKIGSFRQTNKSAFYVQVLTDAKEASENVVSPISVEYRLLSETGTQDWVQANDMNYQSSSFGEMFPAPLGSDTKVRFRYDSTTQAPIMTTNGVTGVQPYDVFVDGNSAGVVGSRIFAFDGINDPTDGTLGSGAEVRVTIGNLQGTNMSFNANNVDCTLTPKTDSVGTQRLIMGDANYEANGQDSYEYRIGDDQVINTCSTAFTSTSYYAAEWITKYVTQLYTDPGLTIKASIGSIASRDNIRVKFKRNGINQEGTIDGAYIGFFNGTGLRNRVSTQTPFPIIPNDVFGCVSAT